MDNYKLIFKDCDKKNRISLNCNNGEDFLNALRDRNLPLRLHIQKYNDLVQAPYKLREIIVHREGLQCQSFNIDGWVANLIYVPQDFVDCLKRLKDTNKNYKQITNFGVFSGSFLSPYMFAKTTATLLSDFCNKYLELLGYPNLVEQRAKNNAQDYFSETQLFEENNLGF